MNSYKIKYIFLAILIATFYILPISYNQIYSMPWPIDNQNNSHDISSFIDDYRSDHFHNGVDIPATAGTSVKAVEAGIAHRGSATDGVVYVISNEKRRTWYIHLTNRVPDPTTVTVGSVLGQVAVNHVHFGVGGTLSATDNPLSYLYPYTDDEDPVVDWIKVCVDQCNTEEWYDLDEIPNNTNVDIIAKIHDLTKKDSKTLVDGGAYKVGWEIDDRNDVTWVGPYYNFQFDNVLAPTYLNNVYFPLSSEGNYQYRTTNQVTQNGYWYTGNPGLGYWRIYIDARDWNNSATWWYVDITIIPVGLQDDTLLGRGPNAPSFLIVPNPTSSNTTISFNLPIETNVSIQVFDVQGRRLETLLSKKLKAGAHHLNWNLIKGSNKFPTGIYYCRFEAGNFKQTKRVLLIKN
jgi:hypothetical protein